MSDMPDWWTKAEKVWEEDDALTSDRETIDAAWVRIFKRTRANEVAKYVFDAGDAILYLYESGRVACGSYPGASEIRLYEPEKEKPAPPKIFCKCSGCNQEHQVWNGMSIPPGWVAFSVNYWPAGFPDPGPLYLRFCGPCARKMDHGPKEAKGRT